MNFVWIKTIKFYINKKNFKKKRYEVAGKFRGNLEKTFFRREKLVEIIINFAETTFFFSPKNFLANFNRCLKHTNYCSNNLFYKNNLTGEK